MFIKYSSFNFIISRIYFINYSAEINSKVINYFNFDQKDLFDPFIIYYTY